MRGRARIGVRGEKGSLPVCEGGVDAGAPFVAPRRVLYIERDHFTAALTRATLEDAGFDVDWFPAVRAAVGPATCARYDVYLLPADGPTDDEAASLSSLAALAGDAGLVLVGAEQRVSAAIQEYWLLPTPCPPALLATAVQSAARGKRQAA
jgi:DNA-binding response OmpR family regulator